MTATFILGGARSGKSSFAQRSAEQAAATHRGRLVFIATAEPIDAEMTERIACHRRERGPTWTTIEAPLELPQTLLARRQDELVVVDCLTLWLGNLMMRDRNVGAEIANLISAVSETQSQMWLVSNEVGHGIVPDNALARRFRDDAGRLHQQVAAISDRVFFVIAGLSLSLK